jgi:uncharacterized membrane protein YqhA
MKQDKAIAKALQRQSGSALPDGFNSRMMEKIFLAEAKRKRQAFILNICLISFVSLSLIAMAVYLLWDSLSALTFRMPTLHVTSEALSQYGFCFYIAFLVMVLFGLDHLFRSRWHKKRFKEAGH